MSHGEGRVPFNEFGRAASRVAVAQICENVGFEGFKDDALKSLSDIAIRWVFDLGKLTTFYASLAGRTECNVFDLIRGLEELEMTQGCLVSDSNKQYHADSDTVKGIIRFVNFFEEIPFAQPIPRFPVIKGRRGIPSFRQMGETPPCKHIPDWLPALPDPHTYIRTPMWNERKTDLRDDKIEQAKQRRKAERSLLNLQQRLLCSANEQGGSISKAPSSSTVAVSEESEKHSPLLQKSLPPGDNDASAIVLQSKISGETNDTDRVSVLEAFAPAIEAMQNGFSDDDDDGEEGKLALPEVRPPIHFTFRSGKKFLCESVDFRFQKKDRGRTSSLTLRDEERDDKKRRAEYILRQSTENPQEFNRL